MAATDPLTGLGHGTPDARPVLRATPAWLQRQPFDLSAEDIVFLRDNGVDEPVVTAMLHQDKVLREERNEVGVSPAPTAQTIQNHINTIPNVGVNEVQLLRFTGATSAYLR